MTITIKPLHLAILAAFIAGILVSAGIVFGLGNNDGDGVDDVTVETTVAPAGIDVAPTEDPTSTPEPTATPQPEPEPTAEPTNAPEIRSCSEIQADPVYRSPEERTFFLENCVGGGPAPAPAVENAPSAPAPSSSEATAAEKLYRDRAQANLVVVASSFAVYSNTPSLGAYNDLLQLGTLFRKFAQEMDRLPPTPPRFEQVHSALRTRLIVVADLIIEFSTIESEGAFNAWLEVYIDALIAMDEGLADYSLVVGIDLPDVFVAE